MLHSLVFLKLPTHTAHTSGPLITGSYPIDVVLLGQGGHTIHSPCRYWGYDKLLNQVPSWQLLKLAPPHMQQVSYGDNLTSNEQVRHTCVPFWASSTMDGKNLFRNPAGTKSNQHNQVPKYAHLALFAQRMVQFTLHNLLGKLFLFENNWFHAIYACHIGVHDLEEHLFANNTWFGSQQIN